MPHYCQNAFQAVALPHNPFSTTPMCSKCISSAINPSNPNVRCPTIVKKHFRLWHYLTPHLQLPRCPQMHVLRHQPLTPQHCMPHYCPNAFQAVALPHNLFSTTPMSSKCIFSAINPSNPNARCPTIVKMHFRLWHYLTPHLQPPPCPQMHFLRHQHLTPQYWMPHYCQNAFQAVALLTTHFPLPPCPQLHFPRVSTPQTAMLDAPLLSKCIPGCGSTSHPIFQCPHVLQCISSGINPTNPNVMCPTIVKMHFKLWHYLKPDFPLPPCLQNAFLAPSTPQIPMLDAPLLSKCISSCGTTSPPMFRCPHVLKMHFVSYQPLKPLC